MALVRIAVRSLPNGGTVEEKLTPDRASQLCLDDSHLAALNQLALQCEKVYGPRRDIEWAIQDGKLYLLQCRAVTTGTGPKPDMIFWHDYDEMAFAWSAKNLWHNAGLGPSDMDFAMLYDGFAPLVLYGLQEYGLVPKGEAGHFLGAGEHLAGGRLPLNPHGGNNSEGRSWAIGHVCEATLQLQGRAGARQLPDVHATVVRTATIIPRRRTLGVLSIAFSIL